MIILRQKNNSKLAEKLNKISHKVAGRIEKAVGFNKPFDSPETFVKSVRVKG